MTPDERLALLSDELLKNADDPKGMKFYLGYWLKGPDNVFSSTGIARDCGTTGCAVGLAMVTPAFNEEGLESMYGEPYFDFTNGWQAVKKYFGLDRAEAEYLFSDEQYSKLGLPISGAEAEKAVAARIKKFLTDRDYRD